MDNFKEDYSNNEESVSTPPLPPTPEVTSNKEKKANAKADKAQKKAEKKAAKAQRPFYKKWWFWVIVLVVFVAMNGKGKNSQQDEYPPQISSEQTAQVESQQESQAQSSPSSQITSEQVQIPSTSSKDRYAFIESHKSDLQGVTKSMVNEYLGGYDIGWVGDWRIVPFDDQDVYFALTSASMSGFDTPPAIIAIFTYSPDTGSYSKHFLSVGDYILYDDHYADEFFENIKTMVGG